MSTFSQSDNHRTTLQQFGQSRLQRYRIRSVGDVYHVTTRGVAQQIIFEDDKDRLFLFQALFDASEDEEVKVLAWCFMGNHIHLILQADIEAVSRFIQLSLSRYARHFNKQHGRSGHLFQDRFYCSPIDEDEYLKTAVRYVHWNPMSMGYQKCGEYQWSSYNEYIDTPILCKTDTVLDVFGSVSNFERFHDQDNNDQVELSQEFEGSFERCVFTDEQAIVLAKSIANVGNLSEIAQMSRPERNAILAELKSQLGVRKTARLTGIGRNIVQRAK